MTTAGVRVALVNRGSIVLPSGDPFSGPLPGSEAVLVNLARELARARTPVTYYGAAAAGTRLDGVPVRPVAELWELDDGDDLRILWLRDYRLPDRVFDRFRRATHHLLTEDAVADMTAILSEPAAATGAHLATYLDRFATVVFASGWHLDDWRTGYGLPLPHGRAVPNLASHVPWRDGPPPGPADRVVHTSHPRKALAVVAAVAERLPDRPRIVCCGGPELYQDDTCLIVLPGPDGRRTPLGSFARFTASREHLLDVRPAVAGVAMAGFLDGFGVLLHPDHSGETGATTVLEAIRRGLVPVVSDLAALPELVGDCGVVVPGPSWTPEFADRCAAALCGVAEDPGRWTAARATARARLDTGPIVRTWQEILQCVPTRRRQHARR